MEKPDFKKGWNQFVNWNLWRRTGAAFGKVWRGTVGWNGWKLIFSLPVPAVLLLNLICGGGLVWVFVSGLEMTVPAYLLYAMSAYSLTVLCWKIPCGIRSGKQWFSRHPKLQGLLVSQELRFQSDLYLNQIINFAYGSFKIGSGVILGSAWIGCDGIYNMAQSLIQLFQILRRKYAKTPEQQWKAYRFCGVLIFLMHLTLTGMVFQTVNWNRAEEHGEIMLITTALFAFYKVITGFVSVAKDRKHIHPVDSSIRMLNLAQAFFAIFSLQASMFHTFGTGAPWEHGMNILTGCTVCLLVISIGIYMIRRGNREIKKRQETDYGPQSIF